MHSLLQIANRQSGPNRRTGYSCTAAVSCLALCLIRYSAFLLLYPVGVVTEMLLLYWGVPFVRERKLYSIFLPNAWNFAWDYAIFVQVSSQQAAAAAQ